MLQKLQQHIATSFPFLHGKKLLIAISSGLDSVVLVHLLRQLDFDIKLAHCNFQLRKTESDVDEEFVLELGKKLAIKTFSTQFETEKFALKHRLSTQVAARNLRYAWFDKLMAKYQFDYVLTAHHADDNLETFLINLTRGTGLEGLTGIPAVNKNIVRPLLCFSRAEILNFAKKNNISWREDQSNASTKYLRNKIRHQIVPVLKEINPNLLTSFAKTSMFLQESQQIIDDRIEVVSKNILEITDTITKINIKKLLKLSNPKAYIYQILKEFGFTAWTDVTNLITAQSGKQVFSKTHRLVKDRDYLLLSKRYKNVISSASCLSEDREEKSYFIEENCTQITHPIHLSFENTSEKTGKNKQTIYVDKDLLNFPLLVRKWQKGDYFYPIGMQGKKKVSKFFKDEKMSLIEKENTWLLCNNNNSIIWIEGKRQDDRFKTTNHTNNVLKITQQ